MFRSLLLIAVAGLTGPIFAQAEKAKEPPKAEAAVEAPAAADPVTFEELVQIVNYKTVKFDNGIRGTNLKQLFETVTAQFQGRVRFVLREDQTYQAIADIAERNATLTSSFTGLTLHDFLKLALADYQLTFLIRKNYIEVTNLEAVQSELKADSEGTQLQLSTPLVCGVYRGTPLSDVVAELSKVYDRTITISANAKEKAKTMIEARLANTPLPTAVDLLASEAGLIALERDGAFIVTTKADAATRGWKAVRQVSADK
jgi:hypothetical protein